MKEHPPPCESVQGLYEWHGEGDTKDIRKFCNENSCGNCGKAHCGRKPNKGEKEHSNLIIHIMFTNEFYKEIVYSKKYTFEALIGNTGGYVGKKHCTIFNNFFFKQIKMFPPPKKMTTIFF